MGVIWVLIPVAVLLVAAFVAMFIWAARDGQFDDMDTPSIRALTDEEPGQVSGRASPARPPVQKEPQ